MAAITPANTTQQAFRADLVGMRFRVLRFSSVATGDEYYSGLHGVVAYGTSANTKSLRVVYDDSANDGLFVFTVTAGPATDLDLYVWGPDY